MTSKTLKDIITEFEGDSLKPYTCPAGKKTIARGFNMDANPLPDDIHAYLDAHGEITQEMSDDLLTRSIIKAIDDLHRIFGDQFNIYTEDRKNALISVMFNVGLAGFKKFKKMIQAVKDGNWELAAYELYTSKRTDQVGNRARIEHDMLREG